MVMDRLKAMGICRYSQETWFAIRGRLVMIDFYKWSLADGEGVLLNIESNLITSQGEFGAGDSRKGSLSAQKPPEI